MLRRITQSPYLNLLSGLILLMTSAYEIMVALDGVYFGVRHGVLIFSIIQIGKVIPEILHGLTEIQESNELVEERE
jgi:membrane protein required for beta-lactamase induction